MGEDKDIDLNEIGKIIVDRNKAELLDMQLNPDKYIGKRPGGLDDYYYKMGLNQQVIDSWEKELV